MFNRAQIKAMLPGWPALGRSNQEQLAASMAWLLWSAIREISLSTTERELAILRRLHAEMEEFHRG